ncbi:MAG: hypothetical protein Ct9H300mP13_6780 [Gammaproteobacteria bacterium]|nr:MAG: hypothetical protein Ct9H300mP13_6780 [Gammaproteobacteria bacterium]
MRGRSPRYFGHSSRVALLICLGSGWKGDALMLHYVASKGGGCRHDRAWLENSRISGSLLTRWHRA